VRLGVAAALVDGERVRGDVEVAQGRVVAVGCPSTAGSGLAVPGYVDLQVNGSHGVDLLGADLGGYERVSRSLPATGVTAFQPTFVSSPLARYPAALATAAEAVRATGVAGGAATDTDRPAGWRGARVLGIHLEGPFLAVDWVGAHDPSNLVQPDAATMERLLAAGPVTQVTLAPEVQGGMDLVRQLIGRGVLVALGHSDADSEQARTAFDAGVRVVTHVHNAHRRWRAREPGPAGVGLSRDDVTVTAIADLIHLAPETVALTWRASRGRFALITDAIEAAGLGDGTYRLGDRHVDVRDGEARLDDGTLAGSVLTMDAAVRNLVEVGVEPRDAITAATGVPAGLISRHELGTLRPGTPADVVVLDDDLEVRRTLVAGATVHEA
jgi:N-acetylglucosamine-6-phosphate deacetylase